MKLNHTGRGRRSRSLVPLIMWVQALCHATYFQFPSSSFYFRDPCHRRSITAHRLHRAALCNAIYQCQESRVRVFRVCAGQQGYTIFSITLELGPEYPDQLVDVDVGKSCSYWAKKQFPR